MQGDTNPDDVREVIKKKKFTTTTDEFAHEKTNKGGKLKGAKAITMINSTHMVGKTDQRIPTRRKGLKKEEIKVEI